MKVKKCGVMMFDDYRKLLLVNREKNGNPKRIGFQVFVKKL